MNGGRSVHLLAVLFLVLGMIGMTGGRAAADDVELSIWSYLTPDDPSVKAYIQRFEELNPNIKIKYTAYPEDDYTDKIRTTLSAHNPPTSRPSKTAAG